jgi:hypothetical protein
MKTDEENLITEIEKVAEENVLTILKDNKELAELKKIWVGGFVAGYINRMHLELKTRIELEKSKNNKYEK